MKKASKKSMRGFSVLGLLSIAIIVVFVVVISMHLIPPYLHNFAIKDALEDLAKNPDISTFSKAKIKDLLSRKMQVNYVSEISPDALVIDKKDGKVTSLGLKYESRVRLIGNIDAVVMFDEQVKVE